MLTQKLILNVIYGKGSIGILVICGWVGSRWGMKRLLFFFCVCMRVFFLFIEINIFVDKEQLSPNYTTILLKSSQLTFHSFLYIYFFFTS
uniref:Uncharacterized protein n=1 Tax=Octopus bimaculoides TaxID=37653 RepID=A0A0L8FHH3_OCTBM